jgi:hypothetical protein
MTIITEPGNLARLLDRQANLWEIRRRLAQEGGEAARRSLAHLEEGPWITFSKQLGSSAEDLADRLGRRLGWQVFGRDLLEAIAQEDRARETVLSRLDEREVGWLEDAMARLLSPGEPDRKTLLHQMIRIVWTLGRKGKAIFLGRGANWILAPTFGLRVRVVAPLEQRAARVAAREGLSPEQAVHRIRDDDDAKAGFIRQVFQREIDDPFGYDLVLNLGGLGLHAATDAVEAALRKKLDA